MSLLAISTALSAQKPVELELWPDGAPNSNGITTPEQKLENNRISNVSEPTLTVYPAAKPNGLAVVACPGGGIHTPGNESRRARYGRLVQRTRHHIRRIEIPYAKRTP